MKEIVNINLGTETAPQVQEVRGKDYIEYGTDNWKNLYPQFLIDLYYNSSTNAAIINATSEIIAGEDIIIDDEDERDLDAMVKLKQFMANPNTNETLHELVKKVAFDFKLQGAFALNIVWSKDRTQIAEIYHVPVEKIRVERPDAMGKVCAYYVSADWGNTRQNKPYRVPAFNINDRTSANQILYSGLYSPNMNSYYTPDYLAGNNWSLIDQKVSEYHLNNISNGFSGSYFISFANGIPTQEERLQIEHSLKEKFTGSESAGRFVLTFSEDRNRVPEITPIAVANADKQFLALQELLVQNILTAHRVTSPMLMGIKNQTGLGSNVDELNSAANYYLNTVCKPYQQHIIKVLRKLFRVNNMDMPISFVQLKPITLQFTSEDLKAVMEQDEIREELGLAPLNEEVVVNEELAKVGEIDGQPVYSTIEEAEAEAEKLGCSGYHAHELEGRTVYMPCAKHDDIQRFSNKTVLEQFIEDYGEEIPQGYELIDEEEVVNEHEDFDFEAELNNIEKLELASTGRAIPNTRSEQDGLNKKQNAFYKVRYVYAENKSLSRKSPSREFCRLMMNANKLYRKEDIIRMNTMPVNPGWGPNGANTYNIWFFKGGANCHHYWKRQIYKTIASEDEFVVYPSNVQSNISISTTKARSEGFTIKRNDSKVAKAPKTMPNNGYLK
ncbi:MAG: putative portal protein [Prokaryotic dsDNA virus sp.]|nr:MAG: putative portal protein [Prokaryotic dsDNA virus sp.]|tara:strand:- start:14864 stop:16870 length:2007 start_codon:yes stop_codon:yes gene_type:complete